MLNIIKKIKSSKDYKEFKPVWDKINSGNIFVLIYSCILSTAAVFLLSILPATIFLSFLFVFKLVHINLPFEFFVNYIMILVTTLSIPQWFYFMDEIITELNDKIAKEKD